MASYYNALRASGADAGKKFLLTPKKLEEITMPRMEKAIVQLREVEKDTAERNEARKKKGEMSKYYLEKVLVSGGGGGNSLQGRGVSSGGLDYHIYEVISPKEVKKVAKIDSFKMFHADKPEWKRYKFVAQKFEFKKDKTNKLIIKKDGKIYKVLEPMTANLMAGFKEAMAKPIEKPIKH